MKNLHFKIKGSFTLESKFTSAYLKEFKNNGGWSHKISDLARTIKPFDWFGINKNGIIFCEVKMIESNIFKFKQLRNNQFTALKRILLLSEKYGFTNFIYPIVLIYSKKFNEYKIINISEILKGIEKGENKIEIIKKY